MHKSTLWTRKEKARAILAEDESAVRKEWGGAFALAYPNSALLSLPLSSVTIMVSAFLAIPFGLLTLLIVGKTLNIFSIMGSSS